MEKDKSVGLPTVSLDKIKMSPTMFWWICVSTYLLEITVRNILQLIGSVGIFLMGNLTRFCPLLVSRPDVNCPMEKNLEN